MLKKIVLAVGLTAGLATSAAADNLAEALVGAYTSSGLLQQNRALLRAADEDVASAISSLRPIVSWSNTITHSFGESRSLAGFNSNSSTSVNLALSAELLVFDNGNSKLGIQAAKETVLATRAGLLAIEQQILLRAVDAYMSVIREGEFVALRRNNMRLIAQELRAAQDRFEVGEVTRTDVALAEARLAEARSELATAEGNLINAQEEYLNAVGKRPGRLSPPPKLPKRPGSLDTAKARAVRGHPQIIQAQHQMKR